MIVENPILFIATETQDCSSVKQRRYVVDKLIPVFIVTEVIQHGMRFFIQTEYFFFIIAFDITFDKIFKEARYVR